LLPGVVFEKAAQQRTHSKTLALEPGRLCYRQVLDCAGVPALLPSRYHSLSCYHQYIERPNTRLIWYESGHKLPPDYVQDAMGWFKAHL